MTPATTTSTTGEVGRDTEGHGYGLVLSRPFCWWGLCAYGSRANPEAA